ncbi:PGPGW domain-containing protein [Candidatus Solirubrobacter pratensis]|uniref:PGPGW domain-containing protein n=1 Tax=Candidatus Solirubrobacter pratensis TaxID=1298857 RepID=UPI00040F5F14|nr:PGPGW domain-containing protein [Candidatus Solirubrobacter pratensis]
MSERPRIIERLLQRQEHHRTRHPVFRIAWGAAGFLVLIAGVIMLVTPGPAFVLIPLGLAMLALEFEWAERLLEKALEEAEKAKRRAENATRTQRVLGIAGTLAVVAACVAAVMLVNVPVLPDS